MKIDINSYEKRLIIEKLIVITIKVSKFGDRSRRKPEGSLFNGYYTEE